MRYLLDTHILIWSMNDEGKIPGDVLAIINDPDNKICMNGFISGGSYQ